MSGLQVFNATPALYWGKQSDFRNPLVSMTAEENGNTARTLAAKPAAKAKARDLKNFGSAEFGSADMAASLLE